MQPIHTNTVKCRNKSLHRRLNSTLKRSLLFSVCPNKIWLVLVALVMFCSGLNSIYHLKSQWKFSLFRFSLNAVTSPSSLTTLHFPELHFLRIASKPFFCVSSCDNSSFSDFTFSSHWSTSLYENITFIINLFPFEMIIRPVGCRWGLASAFCTWRPPPCSSLASASSCPLHHQDPDLHHVPKKADVRPEMASC